MRKFRFRRVEWLAEGCITRKWHSCGFSLSDGHKSQSLLYGLTREVHLVTHTVDETNDYIS